MFELKQAAIRLVENPPLYSKEKIRTPEDAIKVVGKEMSGYDREVVCIINLKTDGSPINFSLCSMGTLNQCVIRPADLFKAAILSNANSMIVLHNHPSGNLEPSGADVNVTKRLIKAGVILDIPILDHVIVAPDSSYYSLRDNDKYQIWSRDNILLD